MKSLEELVSAAVGRLPNVPAELGGVAGKLVAELVAAAGTVFGGADARKLVDALVEWLNANVDLPWYLRPVESIILAAVKDWLYKLVGVSA